MILANKDYTAETRAMTSAGSQATMIRRCRLTIINWGKDNILLFQ